MDFGNHWPKNSAVRCTGLKLRMMRIFVEEHMLRTFEKWC